jgi:hypothetical protein
MRRGLRLALFLGVLVAALSASAEDTLFPLYERYLAAIEANDLAKAKGFLTAGKAKQTKSVADLDVISPKNDLRAHEEIVEDDNATLVVTADIEGNRSTGRVQFARESGKWKILSELWELGSGPEEDAANEVIQPKTEAAREAIRKLREKGYPQPTADFLVMTAGSGELEVLKLFVAAGYSVDTKADGTPAIVSAAMSGQSEVVQYLIDAGADVNAVDEVSTTALMRIASNCEATKTVRALLKAGARTEIKSASGTTAEQLAGYSQCEENAAAIRLAVRKR